LQIPPDEVHIPILLPWQALTRIEEVA